MYKLKLGKSQAFFLSDTTPKTLLFEREIIKMRKLGFDSVDVGLDQDCENRAGEEIRYKYLDDCFKIIEDNGLYLNGIHLSFGPTWEYSCLDKDIREKAISNSCEVFEIADKHKPFAYNFHASRWVPEKRRERLDLLSETLLKLRKCTETNLCVETLPRDCLCHTAEETIELVDRTPGISVCLDVNHFLQERTEETVLKLGSRIKTLHISDYDYEDEKHSLPGTGVIDWMLLIGNLETIGFNGVFNYELGYPFEEVKKNYDELFAKYNALKKAEEYRRLNIAKYGNKQ